jgi:hypothetical protein
MFGLVLYLLDVLSLEMEPVNCIGIHRDRHWIWSLNTASHFGNMTLKLQSGSCSYLQLMVSFLIKTWDHPKQFWKWKGVELVIGILICVAYAVQRLKCRRKIKISQVHNLCEPWWYLFGNERGSCRGLNILYCEKHWMSRWMLIAEYKEVYIFICLLSYCICLNAWKLSLILLIHKTPPIFDCLDGFKTVLNYA